MLSPAPDVPVRAGAREWAALVVLMLPVLLISVDNTVLNFALPEISRELRPTGTQLLWMVDAYPLVLAGLLVPMGALGDRVGRRRLLLVGRTGFAAVSALAAFAPTGEALVAARALLGLFGSMLMPATLSLLRNIFHDPTQRRAAIAVWATGFSAGGILGPVVGGFLLQHFWWGSVFLLAVPVLLPLLVLAPVLVPESRNPAPGPVDVPSAALIMTAMVALVHGIKDLGGHGPSAGVLAAAVLAVTAGTLFVRRQQRSPVPMLDLRLFRHAPFTGGLLNNLVASTTFIGFLFFVSQYLQLVEGLPPLRRASHCCRGPWSRSSRGCWWCTWSASCPPRSCSAAGCWSWPRASCSSCSGTSPAGPCSWWPSWSSGWAPARPRRSRGT